MQRHRRGLLGVRKDPKNQILFSFNVRDGEEWPSDDEDSDYRPGENSDSDNAGTSSKVVKKKKTEKKKVTTKRKEQFEREAVEKKKAAKLTDSSDVPSLPTEIWEKIFQCVVQKDGALPFLCIAPRVCRLWREISSRPHLWKTVDLSSGRLKLKQDVFDWLCRQRLSECLSLNLSNSPVMNKMDGIQTLANHCANLKVLNLSHCKKLPTDSVVTIVNGCQYLEDIDLSSTTADSVSPQTLCHVIDKCGANLRRLVLSTNMLRAFNNVFTALMDRCNLLQHLDISNVNFSNDFMSLDIERFQRNCPHLRTLGLACSSFRATTISHAEEELSPGFPELEELSLAATKEDSTIFTGVTPAVINRLLKTSEKLTVLDLRGCKSAEVVACLEDIPATNLEQLYLGKITVYENLHNILNKWRHSLTDLDLSWNAFSGGTLDLALVVLCSGHPQCPVHNIDMSGTHINMDMVKKLLTSLPDLQRLDLSSCRDVARGCKREYKTSADLDTLRKKFS